MLHKQFSYLCVCVDAPWCGHCQQLAPIYAEAAGKLKKEDPALRLAKVDAAEERELGLEFNILNFPTLSLFVNGDRTKPITYTGKRTQGHIHRLSAECKLCLLPNLFHHLFMPWVI